MKPQKETTFLESLTQPAFGVVPSSCSVRVSPPQPLEPWRIPNYGDADCFDIVVSETAKAFTVTPEQILSRVRTGRIAWARQVAITIYSERSGETDRRVGLKFKRDHGTVFYAIKAVKDRTSVYPKLATAIRDLEGHITAALKEAREP